MPTYRSYLPSAALIKNLGCLIKLVFAFTVLLGLGYFALLALNPRTRRWATQGAKDGSGGPTPFKVVNQILAIPAQALGKTDDVVKANNARVGQLDGLIAEEEAKTKGGQAGRTLAPVTDPFTSPAVAAAETTGNSAPVVSGAAIIALAERHAATSAAPPPLPAVASHLPDDGQDKSRAGSSAAAEAARLIPAGQQTRTGSQQREPAGQTPAGQPRDESGALSMSKRQAGTGPVSRVVAPPAPDTPDQMKLAGDIIIAQASPAGSPRASAAFFYWVVKLNVGGVTQGKPSRVLLNNRLIYEGDEVNRTLGIVFTQLDPANKLLVFRDNAGAMVTRSY